MHQPAGSAAGAGRAHPDLTRGRALGRDTARDARARAKRRTMPDTPDLDRLVGDLELIHGGKVAIADQAPRVDPSAVARHVYGTYSLGRIKLLNLALDSIEISNNGYLSIMTVTREMFSETGTQSEDADGLINYARRIQDVKVAALIHELENGTKSRGNRKRFHVSLRSDGSVDVARIASGFGGGGHAGAAGFSMESSLPELKRIIYGLSDGISEKCHLN